MVNIVENRILNPSEVDMAGILTDLRDIEKEVYQSLNNGERKYLLRMNCKDPVAYKNPESMGQVNSVLAWNTLYPEQEITLPDKLDVILVKIPNLEAIADMKITHPYEYGQFEKMLTSDYKPFKENGIKYLAIPNNIPGIPDFIKPYIDYQYIASRNIGTFKSIMESLEYDINEVTSGGKKMYQFTNIRRDTTLVI